MPDEMAYSCAESKEKGADEEGYMARKARGRMPAASRGGQRPTTSVMPLRRRKKWLMGGAIVVCVLGIGGMVRWFQQREVVTQLQSVGSHRYPRGPAGAPVVIKEFSDYT